MSQDHLCTCYWVKFQKHRASKCSFKGSTKPPKKTNTTQQVESAIDKFFVDAQELMVTTFTIPTRAELVRKLAAEDAKKKALQRLSQETASCDDPISPCGTEDLSPRAILPTNSAEIEAGSGYLIQSIDSVSAEDSLEPTMPALPSMCTPGVFIPAVCRNEVTPHFVHMDAEGSGSVVTGQGEVNEENRSVCDATQFTQEDTVARKVLFDDDQDTVHTLAALSPAEQHTLMELARENQIEDMMAGLMQELEHVVIDGEDDDDGDVSELGNTYFDANTVLVNTDDEPSSVLWAQEVQRLQAENYLLKSQSNTLTLLYNPPQVYGTVVNHEMYSTTDDPSVNTRNL